MSFIPSSEVKANDKKNKKADTSAAPTSSIVTQQDDYCAELDGRKIDFGPLIEKTFLVAVNTGDRNKPKLLASTMRGPFEFYEMVEAVGSMFQNEQHHAKVYILEKSFQKGISFLDEGTIDYLEANWVDLVTTGILEQELFGDEEIIPAGAIDLEYNQESKKNE
jgi:hypothetical protein